MNQRTLPSELHWPIGVVLGTGMVAVLIADMDDWILPLLWGVGAVALLLLDSRERRPLSEQVIS